MVPRGFGVRTGDRSGTAVVPGTTGGLPGRPGRSELQASVCFLPRAVLLTGELRRVWQGRGRGQDCVFEGVSLFLKGVRFNGRIPPLFEVCITLN